MTSVVDVALSDAENVELGVDAFGVDSGSFSEWFAVLDPFDFGEWFSKNSDLAIDVSVEFAIESKRGDALLINIW